MIFVPWERLAVAAVLDVIVFSGALMSDLPKLGKNASSSWKRWRRTPWRVSWPKHLNCLREKKWNGTRFIRCTHINCIYTCMYIYIIYICSSIIYIMCVYWYRYYLIFAFYIWRYFLICVFVCELTYFFWWIYRFTCSPTHHRRIYVGTSYSTSMRCCFVGDEQTQSAGGFCILHNHKVYSRFADRALWTCLQRRSRQGSQKGKWRPDCYGCQQDQTGSNRITEWV